MRIFRESWKFIGKKAFVTYFPRFETQWQRPVTSVTNERLKIQTKREGDIPLKILVDDEGESKNAPTIFRSVSSYEMSNVNTNQARNKL